ncbi:MAG: OmpA family protein [Candidatus Zixiibacteriota bacterium]|nr:MAG: OmpA family protein [candidate division Zixibacteria bacterium]
MTENLTRIFVVGFFALALFCASTAGAFDHKYYLGVTGGASTITGGDSAKFTLRSNYGVSVGFRLSERWFSELSFSTHKNYDDTSATTSFTFGGQTAYTTRKWNATRIGLTASRLLFAKENRLNVYFGGGGGLMVWEILDPITDTTFDVRGVRNEWVDYSASEIFLNSALGIRLMLSGKWSLSWDVRADYLTGAGAEFEEAVKSSRDSWQIGSAVSLKFHFGVGSAPEWKSDLTWPVKGEGDTSVVSRQSLDGDDDGVPNELDNCPDTPRGVLVDRQGCSLDSDRDGVSDGLDDCPGTDQRAAGMVDIYGCPVDSDFDGVADYLDSCPFNKPGAHVDASGCPIDSDADGVPDGLDDCPYTLFGVEVDQFGCIDLSMLAKPMVLNIDYPSGSFEIDPNSRERLKQLSRILNFVPEIRLEVNGYTDNIGTDVANRRLSEKRANRVRDYLVTQGVDTERIKVFGKGETNFVASNQTAAGRAKNRRIEIIFFK